MRAGDANLEKLLAEVRSTAENRATAAEHFESVAARKRAREEEEEKKQKKADEELMRGVDYMDDVKLKIKQKQL